LCDATNQFIDPHCEHGDAAMDSAFYASVVLLETLVLGSVKRFVSKTGDRRGRTQHTDTEMKMQRLLQSNALQGLGVIVGLLFSIFGDAFWVRISAIGVIIISSITLNWSRMARIPRGFIFGLGLLMGVAVTVGVGWLFLGDSASINRMQPDSGVEARSRKCTSRYLFMHQSYATRFGC
jgi:hypothetical protein